MEWYTPEASISASISAATLIIAQFALNIVELGSIIYTSYMTLYFEIIWECMAVDLQASKYSASSARDHLSLLGSD